MTHEQEVQCGRIIHTCAAAAAAGNMVPVPALGVTADIATMTLMAMSLASVFGADIPKYVAKSMAIAAIKRQLLKQPIKSISKEFLKVVPWVGQAVAASISVAMLESAGWAMAREMDREYAYHQ